MTLKTEASPDVPTGGVRNWPILEGFHRLGVKTSKGYELIKQGELRTFKIGRYRLVSDEELRRFTQRRIEASAKEMPADRARKAEGVVRARAAAAANGGTAHEQQLEKSRRPTKPRAAVAA